MQSHGLDQYRSPNAEYAAFRESLRNYIFHLRFGIVVAVYIWLYNVTIHWVRCRISQLEMKGEPATTVVIRELVRRDHPG